MKVSRLIMGMPITVEVIDLQITEKDIQKIFDYFTFIDKKFSPYKKDSEVSGINQKKILREDFSAEMREILSLSEKAKKETNGYFDVYHSHKFDPSGIVKGWAIQNASNMIKKMGFKNFYIEAGGDVQACGKNAIGKNWNVGIRNPFNTSQIVKVVSISNEGVATSGNYERGEHIYNPHSSILQKEIVSITVIAENILQADILATSGYAMGKKGIAFLEEQKNVEAYMIDTKGVATFTSGFERYTGISLS